MDCNASVCAALEPQALAAFTLKLPDENKLPKLTFIEFVPCPLVIVAPVGTVHVYVVAPATAVIEYVALGVPAGHKPRVVPVIVPGIAGIDFIASDFAELEPQAFFDITLTFPDENEPPKLTFIEVVPCPLVIVAPVGTVHV